MNFNYKIKIIKEKNKKFQNLIIKKNNKNKNKNLFYILEVFYFKLIIC